MKRSVVKNRLRGGLPAKRILRRAGIGVLLMFVGVEVSVRAFTNTLWPFVLDAEIMDPMVGSIPKAGVSLRHPTKWYRMTAVENGTRWNGPSQPRADSDGSRTAIPIEAEH